jgi:hypothetical protein
MFIQHSSFPQGLPCSINCCTGVKKYKSGLKKKSPPKSQPYLWEVRRMVTYSKLQPSNYFAFLSKCLFFSNCLASYSPSFLPDVITCGTEFLINHYHLSRYGQRCKMMILEWCSINTMKGHVPDGNTLPTNCDELVLAEARVNEVYAPHRDLGGLASQARRMCWRNRKRSYWKAWKETPTSNKDGWGRWRWKSSSQITDWSLHQLRRK